MLTFFLVTRLDVTLSDKNRLLSCLPFTALQISNPRTDVYFSFKFNPFQLNSDRTALFVTLKRWKSLSINQIMKLATVITVTERYSHAYSK